jgi:hypothetical protein
MSPFRSGESAAFRYLVFHCFSKNNAVRKIAAFDVILVARQSEKACSARSTCESASTRVKGCDRS